jgi:hypothetical protein
MENAALRESNRQQEAQIQELQKQVLGKEDYYIYEILISY